ncbi:MAG: hypothetical protein WBN02_16935 [Sedimenticolaceae bacterium]|jgi:hypothetical protein
MSWDKSGVSIDCGCCEYASCDGRDCFEVTVPISDIETGTAGNAMLLCSISSGGHKVELKEWNDARGQAILPTEEVQQRLLAVLDALADKKVCGNHQICPADVVRIVEQLNGR